MNRANLKALLGKDFPPYLFFDLPQAQSVVNEERCFALVYTYRVRLGTLVTFKWQNLVPVIADGRTVVVGSEKDIAEGLCRSLAGEVKKALAHVRDNIGSVPSLQASDSSFLEVACEAFGRMQTKNPVFLERGDPIPSEFLISAMVWMQNYLDWWEKYSGEKVCI